MKTFKQYIDENWKYNGNSATCMFGVYQKNYLEHNYPHDPDDLCRILQALKLVKRDHRKMILSVATHYNSMQWMGLYQNWNELISIFQTEWNNNKAPKTYAFMQKIYSELSKDEQSK